MDSYREIYPLVAFKLDRNYYCRILYNDYYQTVIVDNLETGLAFGTDSIGNPNHEYKINFDKKIVYHINTFDIWKFKILNNKKFTRVKTTSKESYDKFDIEAATGYEMLSNLNNNSYYSY